MTSQDEKLVFTAIARGQPIDPRRLSGPISGRRLAFLPSIKSHRVLPDVVQVCERLEADAPGSVTEVDVLRREFETVVRRHERLLDRAVPVLGAMAESLPILLAKGSHLRTFAYEASERRVSADVDVYVRAEDVETALEKCRSFQLECSVKGRMLEAYRLHRGQLSLADPGREVDIDLHWWLNNSPLHLLASDFNLRTVWERSQSAVYRGVPVRFPSREDALLLNAIHMGYQHWFQRLRFFIDHAHIMRKVDLRSAARRAQEVGLERALSISLLLTREVTGAEVPDDVIRLLGERPAARLRRREQRVVRNATRPPTPWTRLASWGITNRVTALRFVVRALEWARIYDLTGDRFQARLAAHLLAPGETWRRRLYVGYRPPLDLAVHPLAVGLALLAPVAPFASRLRRLWPRSAAGAR